MKKLFTVLFALTLFAFNTFAQSCSDIVRVKTHANNDRVHLIFEEDNTPTDASVFTTALNGASLTATPGGTSTSFSLFGSGERARYFGLTLTGGAGNFEGTITFNTATPFTCTFNSAGFLLPVSLSSFTAKKMEKSVLLAWETELEVNNDYFVVERSADGKDFEELMKVSGEGNSDERVAYDFEDKSPKSATNYYRLRQVDFDGTEAFSEIVSVKFKDTRSDLNLYPTLVQEELNIDLTTFTDENVTIDILDARGQLLVNKAVNRKEIVTFNLSDLNLSAGTYYVRCQSAGQTTTGKFLVVK